MAPERVPALPQAGSPLAWAVLVTGAVFFAAIAHRAARTFRLTRRRADLAVVVGAVWLGVALLPTLLIAPQTWAWWTGHVLELLGVALVGVPVALDLRRAAPSRPLVGDLRAAELVQAEEAFLGSRVRALVGRLGAHDPSTEQHTRRVALLAVTVGERLGLPPGRLRELAVGALLHDMGKLAVPAAVLNKPGALDDGERALVNEHPGRGDDLLAELGFGAGVRRLVRDHHERLDGHGYPGGRPAAELDLPTRILTVCDVFDALTSHRVYRPAPFTPDAALDLLRGETGTAFDARCVAALADVAGAGVAAPAALAAAA
jgi:HD-GYP domain-containing protein (c-di-GMP phosphodiesterase class II)